MRLLVTIFIVCYTLIGVCQTKPTEAYPNITAKNAVYGELLGSAFFIYNVTYDRIFFEEGNVKISAAIGAQYIPYTVGPYTSLSPQLNLLTGKTKHFFETGIGLAISIPDGYHGIPLRFGYRYQKPKGGIFAKVAFTPIITTIQPFVNGYSILPWVGAAIGKSF